MFQKLQASLKTYGQLRALVVIGNEVIEGRKLLTAMRELGWTEAQVVETTTTVAALSLEIAFDINYADLAAKVKNFMASGASAHDLACISPWSAEKIEYYKTLVGFDWSQFSEFDDQQDLWDEPVDVVPDPGDPEGPELAQGVTKPDPGSKPSPRSPSRPQVTLRPPAPQRAASPLPQPPIPAARPVEVQDSVKPPAPPQRSESWAVQPTAPAIPERKEPEPVIAPDLPDYEPVVFERVEFLGSQSAEETNWQPQEPPQLDGIDDIDLDTETNGLRWFAGDRPIGISISFGEKTQYLPWAHSGGNLDEAVVRRWAQRELRGKRITGANIGFDIHMLREWGVNLEEQGCTVSDVQHPPALLDDYRRRFALNELAKDFLGKEKTGQDFDKTRMAEYHASAVAPYAEYDVQLVKELRLAYVPLLEVEGLQKVKALEDAVIYPTLEMEKNAAPIDRELLMRWCAESERELTQLLMKLATECGFQVNPDKNDDMLKLFRYCKLPVTHFTDKGTPSFTDAVLKDISHPLVQKARRAGKVASLRSKFLMSYAGVVGDDGLLRFSLHQLRGDEYGTNRGRYSASHKNIQQVMTIENQREAFGFDEDDDTHDDEIYLIRKLFIAGMNGASFLSADAEQIEYRLGAHFANSPKVIAAYAADPSLDYHNLVMELIRPHKADITRKKAKSLNFAKVYGAGKDKIAESLGLPRSESDKFVDLYDQMFPEVKAVLYRASDLAEKRGYVKTILGRRARFPDKRFCHKSFNAVDQGSAADIFKQKLIEVHAARKITGFVMRMPVHDELCGDSPDRKCAEMIHEILNRQSFNLRVPITWKVKTGKNWSEC